MGIAGAAGATSASSPTTTPQPRLVRAAHEFEAQMMKELLKPMTSGDALTGEDDSSSAGSSGALGEYASESLGRALSDQGGFGIANRIVKDLTHFSNQPGSQRVTRDLHGNTVMRSLK
jgi:Rod binding domain-containing protein